MTDSRRELEKLWASLEILIDKRNDLRCDEAIAQDEIKSATDDASLLVKQLTHQRHYRALVEERIFELVERIAALRLELQK